MLLGVTVLVLPSTGVGVSIPDATEVSVSEARCAAVFAKSVGNVAEEAGLQAASVNITNKLTNNFLSIGFISSMTLSVFNIRQAAGKFNTLFYWICRRLPAVYIIGLLRSNRPT